MSSFLSTGTEACQLALRLARAVTGKHDRSSSSAATITAGRTRSTSRPTPRTTDRRPADRTRTRCATCIVLDWGGLGGAATRSIAQRGRGGDHGARRDQRRMLRAAGADSCAACANGRRAHGVVLIFDEVITGFRLALGGAQARIRRAAGHHRARQGARRRHADQRRVGQSRRCSSRSSSGEVSQRGTYNGHPLSVAAAVACLDHLAAHAGDDLSAHGGACARHRRARARHRAATAPRSRRIRLGPCVQLFAGAARCPRLPTWRRSTRSARST